MKRLFLILTLSLSMLKATAQSDLARSFADPDFEYGPWVFWMWMNGNVTKEGITLDLEAMHRVGISGAILFTSNAGLPAGKVEYASGEWYDLNRYTFAEAERLGMRIMLHNCSGYTASGGPWIKPENSMQQVVWTESFVRGDGTSQTVVLPKPFAKLGYYEEIAVIAYPSLKGEDTPMAGRLRKVTVNGRETDGTSLTDFNYETYVEIDIPDGKRQGEMVLEFDAPYEAASVVARRMKTPIPFHPYDGPRDDPPTYTLEASDDGEEFTFVGRLGWGAVRELNAPASVNFEAVKARYYRILTNKKSQLTEFELFTAPRLSHWERKANYTSAGRADWETEAEFNTLDPQKYPSTDGYVIDRSQITDISCYMDADGILQWKAPAGNWTILRIGHTTTGEENAAAPFNAQGLEIDKMNRRGLANHYEGFLKKLLDEMEPWRGKSFYGLTVDSWEAGTQNWTKGFENEFFRRHQYSLIPYLAAFTGRIVDGTHTTDRFLGDIRKTQATLVAENFHQALRDLCHRHGLSFLNETYGDGPFDSMEAGRYADIPAGEFWAHMLYGNPDTNNQAGYLARSDGKKIALAEAFTAMPDLSKFTEYPAAMKAEGDWMITNGINRLAFHTFAHQPHPTAKPGMTMGPFGTHMNRNQTWWEQSKPYMDYLRRTQYMLQHGEFISSSSTWTPPGMAEDPTQKKNNFSYRAGNPNALIHYIHKKEGEFDYFFVSNGKRAPEQIEISFDVAGKQPFLWHPETGEQTPIYNYRVENGKTVVPLDLDPSESLFVVFYGVPDREPFWYSTLPARAETSDWSGIYDNFTVNVWLRPDVIAKPGRSNVIYPESGERLYGLGHATIGLAVGQDGIRLSEQHGPQTEQVLTAKVKIEGWSLVTVVYRDGTPTVYLNGTEVGRGTKSGYTVHPNSLEISPTDALITIFQGEYLKPEILPQTFTAREIAAIHKNGKPAKRGGKGIYGIHGDRILFEANGHYSFGGNNTVQVSEVLSPIEFQDRWTVDFPQGSGAPQSIVVKDLQSLHLHKDPRVKYFSGTAVYNSTVSIPAEYMAGGRRVLLDLGNVAYFAEVSVNGRQVATLWKPPYETDVTDYVVPGDNRLEVKVTNLWTNRLIGDEFLAEENHYDKWGELEHVPDWYVNNLPYNGKRNTFVAWRQYDRNGPLTESGLIGPVRIVPLVEKRITR